MFSPHQIWQWRLQVGEKPELRRKYEGRYIETIEINFDQQPSDLCSLESLGDLYLPAKIFGEPLDPHCLDEITSRTISAAPPILRTFRNAKVIGFSAILSKGGVQVSYTPRAANSQHFMDWNSFGSQGFIAEQIDKRTYVHFGRREHPYLFNVHALFFPNVEPGNYGSFLVRVLPQMLWLASIGIQADCYIVAERTPWMLEALQLLGFADKPVYAATEITGDTFASITMCIMHDVDGFIRPETHEAIQQITSKVGGRASSALDGKRFYVSRDLKQLTSPDYRPMINEAEVQALVSARDFTIIRPEILSLTEQMRIFSLASHIVGASGSGMLNAIFSLHSARIVDIETFSFGVAQHAKIYASCGHEYAFVFCDTDTDNERAPHLRRWSTPIPLLEQALDWCLS